MVKLNRDAGALELAGLLRDLWRVEVLAIDDYANVDAALFRPNKRLGYFGDVEVKRRQIHALACGSDVGEDGLQQRRSRALARHVGIYQRRSGEEDLDVVGR